MKKKTFDNVPYNDKKNFARVLFRNRLKNKLNVYNVRIYKKNSKNNN